MYDSRFLIQGIAHQFWDATLGLRLLHLHGDRVLVAMDQTQYSRQRQVVDTDTTTKGPEND